VGLCDAVEEHHDALIAALETFTLRHCGVVVENTRDVAQREPEPPALGR
jgi:hypothetical protein